MLLLISRAEELESVLWKEKGFKIRRMKEDGNCLFRAISDQVYGDPEMHPEVRELCMDYLLAERGHFSQFVTQDFDEVDILQPLLGRGGHLKFSSVCAKEKERQGVWKQLGDAGRDDVYMTPPPFMCYQALAEIYNRPIEVSKVL
eukprot:757897-Hanusia_phi.AAC.1